MLAHKKSLLMIIPVITAGLLGCAPSTYQKAAQDDQERSNYRRGVIDCSKQTLMTVSDCELGVYSKATPNQDSINLIKSYGINTPAEFDAALAEANTHKDFKTVGLSPDQKWSKLISFLQAKKYARERGMTVDQWVATGKANAKKLNDEMNKEYPFTVQLTCTMNGMQTMISACFAPLYSNDGGTVLELTNGKDYKMFQWMQVERAGVSNINGQVTIPLRSSFKIKAQNNSSNFLLNVVVKNSASDAVLYRKSAQQFGWIQISN